MARKIEVFGILIETCTVRENMQFFEEFLNSEELNIVSILSSYMLMSAVDDAWLKEFISMADLRVIADPVIYEVADGKFEQQFMQVKKQMLEEEFIKCLIRKKKKVYWIGENEEQLRRFQNYIKEHYSELSVNCLAIGDEKEENVERILNQINSVDVDVLILNLNSPAQERFIFENKNFIRAKLCICMGEGVNSKYASGIRISKLKGLIDQNLFKRRVIKYNSTK